MKIPLISLLAVLLMLAAFFYIYVSDYYKADSVAVMAFQTGRDIQVLNNLTILSSEEVTDTAFVFYPGAKVEAIAYLPILEQLRQNGITCILVEMPFNMAIFKPNAADEVFELFPNIKNWYIGGHSMGGAMASSYASKNSDKVKGLILLGAYVYGDYPPEKALTVYGTFNSNLEKNIDYTENIVVIDGGNHAQFGNYGRQKGDPDATITQEEQQDIAVEAILEFIE
ncbi:MAG TPA: alpha/beta fold hydrolase [Epulopiscium sp.]|nr:alpha/beta fold hydrolase [Candidatus Epulonipiscium sp.]